MTHNLRKIILLCTVLVILNECYFFFSLFFYFFKEDQIKYETVSDMILCDFVREILVDGKLNVATAHIDHLWIFRFVWINKK